jgi:hypothetical protein
MFILVVQVAAVILIVLLKVQIQLATAAVDLLTTQVHRVVASPVMVVAMVVV